jgi:hypothetical protein
MVERTRMANGAAVLSREKDTTSRFAGDFLLARLADCPQSGQGFTPKREGSMESWPPCPGSCLSPSR